MCKCLICHWCNKKFEYCFFLLYLNNLFTYFFVLHIKFSLMFITPVIDSTQRYYRDSWIQSTKVMSRSHVRDSRLVCLPKMHLSHA